MKLSPKENTILTIGIVVTAPIWVPYVGIKKLFRFIKRKTTKQCKD
jgi:hypothetical protein